MEKVLIYKTKKSAIQIVATYFVFCYNSDNRSVRNVCVNNSFKDEEGIGVKVKTVFTVLSKRLTKLGDSIHFNLFSHYNFFETFVKNEINLLLY